MAEEAQIQLGLDVDDAGVAAQIEATLNKAFSGLSGQLGAQLGDVFTKAIKGADQFQRGFNDIGDAGKRTLGGLTRSAEAFDSTAKGIGDSLRRAGSALSPGAFSATERTFNDLSQLIERLQRQIRELGAGGLDTDVTRNLTASLRSAANQANVAQQSVARETAISARGRAEAERVAQQDATRLAIAGSKERIVAAQQEGSQTLAAVRSSSAQRVAVIKGITTAVKGLEDVFGRVVSGGSSLLGKGISGVSSTLTALGGALRRSNSEMTQGLSAAVDKRTSILREGFTRQETIVRESVSRSQRSVEKFNTVTAGGLTGLATGRSNAANALGIGGLLSGGFLVFNQLKEGITGAEDFRQTMAVLQVQLGLTDAQMKNVHDTSIQLGNDLSLPGVSATDAGAAINILTRQFGSLGPAAIDAATAAAKGTLQLARATGAAADDAASVIGAAVNVFGIGADQAVTVADEITGALAKAAGVSFTDFKEAFVQGATVFENFVGPAESANDVLLDFNTSLATLAKSGIIGETAGAGLKQFFISVAGKQTEKALDAQKELVKRAGETGTIFFDSAGKARTFSDSVGILRKSLEGMTDAQRTTTLTSLFGARAQTIASALVATSAEDWDSLRLSMQQQGLAAKVAAAQNQGLRGAMDALGSVIDTNILLAFEALDEPLGNAIVGMADFVNKLTSADGIFATARDALKGIALALGGLLAAKAAIEVVQLLGLAFGALLTPMGLLIGGVALVGGALGVLTQTSDGVAGAVETVKESIIGFFGEIRDGFIAMVTAFQANDPDQTTSGIAGAFERLGTQARILFNFIGDEIIPVIVEIADVIKTNFVAAFAVASNFLRQDVIPALQNFVDFITGTAVPAVRDGLATAFSVAGDAISSFWDTVRPVLQPAIDGIGSLVSAIGDLVASNPGAALAGIGAVLAGGLGGFALGGPLGAAIGGLGAGVAALFATGLNSNLGDALSGIGETIAASFSNLGGVISDAVSSLFDSIDFGALLGSAFEASGFARDVGATLGRLLSSPQLVAGLAGLAALAATFAAQFLIGFGQGVVDNIPALTSLIGDALKVALQEGLSFALDNPTLLIGGLVAFFAGRGFLNLFKTAGTQAGTEMRGGLLQSLKQNAFGGVFSGGGTGGGFFTGLFGGANGINAGLQKEFEKAQVTAAGQVRKMNATLALAGRQVGNVPSGQSFGKAVLDEFTRLTNDIGPKGVFGLRLRGGIQAAIDSVRTVSLSPLKSFFNDMNVSAGQAIKAVGKTVATGLAGAFAGFQVGQSVAGQSLGTQLLGVGGLALGLGAVNPLMGAAAGAAGVLGIAFGNMGKKAEEAKSRIHELSTVIQGAGGDLEEAAAGIGQKITEALQKSVDPEVLQELIGAGFDLSNVVDDVTIQGRSVMDALNRELDTPAIRNAIQNSIPDDQFFNFFNTLRDELNALPKATTDAANAIDLKKQFDANATSADLATGRLKAYQDRLQQLNTQEPGSVKGVEDALNRIPGAADAAKTALDNFLGGAAQGGGTLQQQLNDFVIEIPSLQAKVDQINAPDLAPLLKTALNDQLGDDIQANLRGRVSVAISSGAIVPTIEGVQGFLDTLTGQVQTLMDQGTISAQVGFNVIAQIRELQTDPDLAAKLKAAIETGVIPPEVVIPVTPVASIPPGAMEDFKGSISSAIAGATSGPQGFGGGGMSKPGGSFGGTTVDVPITLNPDITVNDANAQRAGAQVAAAFIGSLVSAISSAGAAGAGLALAAAVQMASGGGLAIAAGGSLAQRFAAGILGGIGSAVGAAHSLGTAASNAVRTSSESAFAAGRNIAEGLAAGVRSGTGAAVAAAQSMANQVAAVARTALRISSPSKVFEDIGAEIGRGMSQGIADSADDVSAAMSGVLEKVIGRATTIAQATAGVLSQLFDTLLPASRGDVGAAGNVSNLALTRTRASLTTLATDLQSVFDQSAIDLWNAVAAGPAGDAKQRLIAAQFQGFGLSFTGLQNNSVLGSQNVTGFLEVGEKIRAFISESVNAGENLGGVISRAQQYRQQLLDVVAAYGASTDQATNLLQTLGLLDPQLQQFIDQAAALRAAAATPSAPTATANTAADDAAKAAKDAEIAALKEQLRLAAIGGKTPIQVNVYPPFGDPEAIGLGAANKVAVLLAG